MPVLTRGESFIIHSIQRLFNEENDQERWINKIIIKHMRKPNTNHVAMDFIK